MAAEDDLDLSTLQSQLSETQELWKQEMEKGQSQVDVLQAKTMEVKACIQGSEEESKKELDVLRRMVKATATLLTFLRSKARVMAVPDLAHKSCGIRLLEGVGLVDKEGTPLSGWSRSVDLSSFDSLDDKTWIGTSRQQGSLDEQDGAYIGELIKSVQMVTDVMEVLVKRVIMAESETALEKEKVTLGQEEIKKKAVQIENMSIKLEEMERFALGTNSVLNEMRQRVEDLVEETFRQRQRAAENEQELSRVKQDFESMKSYVSSLISVRETLLSSEKQFQTIERLFERLVAKTTQLEGEKKQKEVEVQKLMEDNVRLTALLDKKEAQLLAMNEQCKSTNRRLNDIEICVPIVYGTIAFYLGRKASDCHHLKLYPEDESGRQSTRKPVVMESYNEIVSPDPSECFFARAQNHPAVLLPRLPAGFSLPASLPVENMNEKGRADTKNHPLNQWFMNFSEADELLKLAAVRQQVQAHIVKLRRQLSVIDEMPQPLKPASSYKCT